MHLNQMTTLDEALAFLNRLRHEARTRGSLVLTPAEFIAAVELGAIEYLSNAAGVSLGGNYVGEYSPTVAGASVEIDMGERDAVAA